MGVLMWPTKLHRNSGEGSPGARLFRAYQEPTGMGGEEINWENLTDGD
jgi:hypothetical protein